jgi:hypothetical protein
MTSEESVPVESAADIPAEEKTIAAVAALMCGCKGSRAQNGKVESLMIVIPGAATCPYCKYEYEVKVTGRKEDGGE